MRIDGVAINHQWAASMSQEAFIKELSGEGYAHIWPGIKDRRTKIKEAHALCKQKVAQDNGEAVDVPQLQDTPDEN